MQGRTTLHVSLAFVPPSLSLLTKRHAGRIHSSRGGGAVLSGAGSSPRSAIGFSQLYVFKKKKKKRAWLGWTCSLWEKGVRARSALVTVLA